MGGQRAGSCHLGALSPLLPSCSWQWMWVPNWPLGTQFYRHRLQAASCRCAPGKFAPSAPASPGSCWWKSRSQTVFHSTLQCPQPPWAPTEVQGALSHSAFGFTRPGHEVGDRLGPPCAVQREAARSGPPSHSLAPQPLCECQRSIPLISQIDGIV